MAAGALLVVPLVVAFLRDSPAAVGLAPVRGVAGHPDRAAAEPGPTRSAPRWPRCRDASRTGAFWLLAGSFAICGATTNGLIGTHFIPAAHDHGMPGTTAAGLLALVGIFDIAGTLASGWLTDRVDPRRLLLLATTGCAASRCSCWRRAAGATGGLGLVVFVVVYGLDWVATVPPTVALCNEVYGERGAGRLRLGLRLPPGRRRAGRVRPPATRAARSATTWSRSWPRPPCARSPR